MFKTFRQQETVGCNAQGGVMMKATPAASLVVAQAEFLFKLLIVPLNAPAHLGGSNQIHQRGISGQRRQPILGRFCLILWPFDQQPLILTWRTQPLLIPMRSPHSDRGKARRQFLVGSLAPNHRVPSACAQRFAHPLHTERCGARHTLPACPGTPDFVLALRGHRPRAGYPHRGDRLHPNAVLQLHPLQRFTPRRVVAIARPPHAARRSAHCHARWTTPHSPPPDNCPACPTARNTGVLLPPNGLLFSEIRYRPRSNKNGSSLQAWA